MPPKPKITREEILASAYDLALREGFGSLSSRNIARAAGCSVQPVFSHFPTMDSLRQEIYSRACRECAQEVLDRQGQDDLLAVMCRWMLDLAKNRPNLFNLLYLSDLAGACTAPASLMQTDNHRKMVEIISQSRDLTLEESEDVLIRSCIFLMGIGTMVSVSQVDIHEAQVLQLMERTIEDFVSGSRHCL